MYMFNYLIRYVLVLHEEHFELTDTNSQIAVCHFVWDVKTERSKLPPLQYHAVEQAEREQHHLKCLILHQTAATAISYSVTDCQYLPIQ